jgi:predicted nucleic acid-binding protein
MSKELFADTSYYIALLLISDSRHARAAELTREYNGQVVTTTWVMLELGNFFSSRCNNVA